MTRTEWNFKHAACPACGNTSTKQTLIGVPEFDLEYEDNVNTAECSCGWKGYVKDLVPANTGQAKPLPIRILDFDGETYANTKDMVVTLLDFNKKLNATLPREDQQKFTDAIFGEITKMIVTVDKQHWVNKYEYQAKLQDELKQQAKEDLDNSGKNIDEKTAEK